MLIFAKLLSGDLLNILDNCSTISNLCATFQYPKTLCPQYLRIQKTLTQSLTSYRWIVCLIPSWERQAGLVNKVARQGPGQVADMNSSLAEDMPATNMMVMPDYVLRTKFVLEAVFIPILSTFGFLGKFSGDLRNTFKIKII